LKEKFQNSLRNGLSLQNNRSFLK